MANKKSKGNAKGGSKGRRDKTFSNTDAKQKGGKKKGTGGKKKGKKK